MFVVFYYKFILNIKNIAQYYQDRGMAISSSFLRLFTNFIENYKKNNTASFYSWAKEPQHDEICNYFDELLTIITDNQELFSDTNIIESHNTSILLSAKSNQGLLTCWIDFINRYNDEVQIYSSFTAKNKIHIQVKPESSSVLFKQDLQRTIQKLYALLEKADDYHKTKELLLHSENEQLKEHNEALKKELIASRHTRSILENKTDKGELLIKLQTEIELLKQHFELASSSLIKLEHIKSELQPTPELAALSQQVISSETEQYTSPPSPSLKLTQHTKKSVIDKEEEPAAPSSIKSRSASSSTKDCSLWQELAKAVERRNQKSISLKSLADPEFEKKSIG